MDFKILGHLSWLWFWFIFGELTYVLKRAYFLVTGPNPIATNYGEFIARAWPALIVRGVVGAGIYWLTFYPEVMSDIVSYYGWNIHFHSPLPQYAVVALFFGLFVDFGLDFIFLKIPGLKDWLPQMPAPLVSVKDK